MFSQEKVNEVLLLQGCALPSHHRQTSWYMRAMVCLQPWSCPDDITVRSTGPSRYRPTHQHHACAPDLLRLSDWKSHQCVVSLLVPGSCQSHTHAAASRTLVSQGKTQHFQHGKVWPNALFSFFFFFNRQESGMTADFFPSPVCIRVFKKHSGSAANVVKINWNTTLNTCMIDDIYKW